MTTENDGSTLSVGVEPLRIFISYRHQEPDRALAHEFADALKGVGHDVFIDTGIAWGRNWAKAIRQALETTDFLLLLLSKEAAASEMVVEEVVIARELGQSSGSPKILPLRVNCPFSEPLPYHLSAILRTICQISWERPGDTPAITASLLKVVNQGSEWGEASDGAEAGAPFCSKEPEPAADPRSLNLPGGAIGTLDTYYVERAADEDAIETARRPRQIITVKGPRQSGKTSLILRTYGAIREIDKSVRAVFIDFQSFSHRDLESLEGIWRAVSDRIDRQLDLRWDRSTWNDEYSYHSNVDQFMLQFALGEEEQRLLLCLDEIDRVFTTDCSSDFCASIRSYYNQGAYDPYWKRVSWILGTSSEPSFFIKNLDESPFNIGRRVELRLFGRAEIESFAVRLGVAVEHIDAERIRAYVGGHPYLTHLLLYHIARGGIDTDRLFDPVAATRTIFREHVRRFLLHFQREDALAGAMKDVISGRGCHDVGLVDRLAAAGLVRMDKNSDPLPLCDLYAHYFRQEL